MGKRANLPGRIGAGIAGFCLALCAAGAGAGTLEWSALPDRERVTIRLDPSEGMAARIGRIAPDGVVIPFTHMPSGLLVNETPQGAAIFKNTQPMGRALVLVTQTPEFGFMVAGQNKQEIVVDFFHNPLGARWKPGDRAPATELVPDRNVRPEQPPDAVNEALLADPRGETAQSRFLASRSDAALATPEQAPQTRAENPAQPGASAASPAVPANRPAPDSSAAAQPSVSSEGTAPAAAPVVQESGPVVVALPGTPQYAMQATRMGEAPPARVAPTPTLSSQGTAPRTDGPSSGNRGASGQPPSYGTGVPDGRRNADLPEPSLPAFSAMTLPTPPSPPGLAQTEQLPGGSEEFSAGRGQDVQGAFADSPAARSFPPPSSPSVQAAPPSAGAFARQTPVSLPAQAVVSPAQAVAAPPAQAVASPAQAVAPPAQAPPVQAVAPPAQAVAAQQTPAFSPPPGQAASPAGDGTAQNTAGTQITGQGAAENTQETRSLSLVSVPAGVGAPAGNNAYRGSINKGGLENIVFPAEAARTAPPDPRASGVPGATPEARPAPPGGGTSAPPGQDQTRSPASTQSRPQARTQPPAQPPAQTQPTAQPPAQPPAQPAQSQPPAQPAQSQPQAQPAQTQPPAQPAQTQPPAARTQPPAQAQAQANATAIVYTDEQGNPVAPPPTYADLHPKILEHMKSEDFAQSLELADLLLEKADLTPDQHEDLLHIRSESLFALYKDDIPGHFTEIADAAQKALSYNPGSRRNSAELLRLGYMNLRLNNFPEAEANFRLLRSRFPDGDNVALSYYYQGDFFYGRGELQKAADQFQHLIETYPNSRYTRESALGLARSFYRMGYYDQAYNVVDYIQRRWGRFYIEYPPFLNMLGDMAFRLGKRDEALKHYWLYINLEPQGEEADVVMTRIGDIYSQMREKKSARAAYLESAARFPDKDGGLVAMMRMAEEGINDTPTIAGMFSVFDGPFKVGPLEVYRNIIEKHPQSSLAPLAEIKLALWYLWNKDYTSALDVLSGFMEKYPDHELAPRAREIAAQTFAVLADEGVRDERYQRMLEIWERYAIVRAEPGDMTPESRVSLAVSYRQQGKPDEALRMLEPFFLGNWIADYSEMALSLVLGIYLEYEQWPSIREVARRVESWNMSPAARQQLDYALALAAENLGEPETAAPIWQALYDSGLLSPAQRAYAAFFLAMGAERQKQLERAYHLGLEALSGLRALAERSANPADLAKVRTQLASLLDVTESAGRLKEAMDFAGQYLEALPENDPERLGVRYRMARICKNQGDADGWKSILGEIASQAPDSVYGKIATSELKAASIAEDAARYSPTGRI